MHRASSEDASPLALALVVALTACSETVTLVQVPAEGGPIIVRNARVLDVLTGSVAAGRDVHIRDGLIEQIRATQLADVPGATIIDAAGATLVPGLIDAHVHLGNIPDPVWKSGRPDPRLNLARLLYCGVTTAFETGGMITGAFDRRDKVATGGWPGPRVVTTGPVFTAVEGHPVPMLEMNAPWWISWYIRPRMIQEVDSVAAAQAAVDVVAAAGPDLIKVIVDRIPEGTPRLEPPIIAAVVAQATARGLRTVAHIGRTQDAIDAAEAGVAAWVHGVYKERIAEADVARLARYGIPMTPTLVVFDSYGAIAAGERRVASALETEVVAAEMLEAFNAPPDDYTIPPAAMAMMKLIATQRANAMENVRALHEAGVTILAGSDAQRGVYHGPGLHRELRLLAQAGLPAIEVLRAATLHPARFITGTDDPPYGVIAAGKVADLVLVDGDPLENVSALSQIRAVIRAGRIVERTTWADARAR